MTNWTMGRFTKKASKGWISGNAVCCIHNGETPDYRGRGGILESADGGFSYSCFNCGFKTGWRPGWHIGFKLRKFMGWIGIDESAIKLLVFEAFRIRDEVGYVEPDKEEISIEFEAKELPEGAKRIKALLTWYGMSDFENTPDDLMAVIDYATDRGLTDTQIANMYWTEKPINRLVKMNRRLIIPFTWDNEIIGYTARSIDAGAQMKYQNVIDSNFVFNVDAQKPKSKVVLVSEGPMDALSIDGVAILGNAVSETKAEIIERLNREVIVVPDRGDSGQKLVDVALEYGWTVSFPDWADDDVKDINDAVCQYGKLYTFQHVMKHKYDTRLKIELMRKKY